MSETKLDAFDKKVSEIKASKPVPYVKKETNYSDKNYLNTRLGENEPEKEFQVRVLPLDNESDNPFEEVYFHWDAKAKKSFVCPKHTKNTPAGTNKECPYCDVEEGYWAEYRKSTDEGEKKNFKKSANEYKAQANDIFRVIDRLKEEDGPCFWKVAETVLTQIQTVKNQNKKYNIDIFDLKNGKDLLATFKKVDGKSKFSSIMGDIVQSPACSDDTKLTEWIGESLKWYEVFTIKSFEYMEVVLNGGSPWFDKPTNKWIDKKDLNKIEVEDIDDSKEETGSTKTDDSSDEEDLPF